MRYHLVFLILLLPAGIVGASAPGAGEPSPRKPNIIVILSDDMGFSDLGCYGGEIQTPASFLIRWRLEACVSHSSIMPPAAARHAGRCSRAFSLTRPGIGHMTEDGDMHGYRGQLNDRCVTLAEALRPAGYRTYMCGKWHVTRMPARPATTRYGRSSAGFEQFYGTITGAGSFYDPTTLCRQNTFITPESDPSTSPPGSTTPTCA